MKVQIRDLQLGDYVIAREPDSNNPSRYTVKEVDGSALCIVDFMDDTATAPFIGTIEVEIVRPSVDCRFHATLEAYGWTYSHVTPITARGGERYYHVTYVCRSDSNWVIGVDLRPMARPLSASRLGSSREYRFEGYRLKAYLARKNKQLRPLDTTPVTRSSLLVD